MSINPILLDIPHQFESSRLILRIPRDGDSKITFPVIQESLDMLKHAFPAQVIPNNIEETEEMLRETRADLLLRRAIHLLIFRQDTGDFIGETRVYNFDWQVPRASLAFWLRSSAQGEGYMSEAVNRVVDIGFDLLNLARLELMIDTQNSATQHIAENVGFILEGTRRNYRRRFDGELTNTMVYSIIPSDRGNTNSS